MKVYPKGNIQQRDKQKQAYSRTNKDNIIKANNKGNQKDNKEGNAQYVDDSSLKLTIKNCPFLEKANIQAR